VNGACIDGAWGAGFVCAIAQAPCDGGGTWEAEPRKCSGCRRNEQGGEVERVLLRFFFRNFIRSLCFVLRGGQAVGSYLT
jgi:hypothetical protein